MAISAACPVRIQRLLVAAKDINPHDHDYYELCLVLHGTATHLLDDGDQNLQRGSAIVLSPSGVHGFTNCSELNVINIYYLAEWLSTDLRWLWDQDGFIRLFLGHHLFPNAMKPTTEQFLLSEDQLINCERELNDLEMETRRVECSPIFLKSTFLKFLVLLFRGYQAQQASVPQYHFRPEVRQFLDSVESSLTQGVPFSVKVFAEKIGLSTDHFSRLVQSATGWTPIDYYQHRRIQHACSRLLNPKFSLTQIAFDLNFSDSAHFSRTFKKQTRVTPKDYRNRYCQNTTASKKL